jgi:hypothetical protein
MFLNIVLYIEMNEAEFNIITKQKKKRIIKVKHKN